MMKGRTSNSCHYSEKRKILPPLPVNKNTRRPHQNPISNPSNPIIKDSSNQYMQSSLKNTADAQKQNQRDQLNSNRNSQADQLTHEVGNSNNYLRSSLHITQTQQNNQVISCRKRNRNSFKIRSKRDHRDSIFIGMEGKKNRQNVNTQLYRKQMRKNHKKNINFEGTSQTGLNNSQETAHITYKARINIGQQRIEGVRVPFGQVDINSNQQIQSIRKTKMKSYGRERIQSKRQVQKYEYEQSWDCHSKNLQSDEYNFYEQKAPHQQSACPRKTKENEKKKQQTHSTPKLSTAESGKQENNNLSHQNKMQNNHHNVYEQLQLSGLNQRKGQSNTRNDLAIDIPTSQEIDIPFQNQNCLGFPMPKKLKKSRRPAFKDVSNQPNGRPTRRGSIIQKYKAEISESNGKACQNQKQVQSKGQTIKELGIQSIEISEFDNNSKEKKDRSKRRRKIDECKTHKVIWGSSKSKPFNVGVSSIFTSEMPRDHPLESLKQLYLQIN